MKKFKIAISLLLCACTLCLFSGVASASSPSVGTATSSGSSSSGTAPLETSSGSAFLNMWYTGPYQLNCFQISNITDHPIDVSMIIYNEDGTLLTDDGSSTSGFVWESPINNIPRAINYSDKNTDSTVSFTLTAHSTMGLIIGDNKTTARGYGIIKWVQKDSILHGLVVCAHCQYDNGNIISRVPESVNNGMPF